MDLSPSHSSDVPREGLGGGLRQSLWVVAVLVGLNRPGFLGGSYTSEGSGAMKRKSQRYSPELIERAIRMGDESGAQHESQCAAIVSIAAKIGCTAST